MEYLFLYLGGGLILINTILFGFVLVQIRNLVIRRDVEMEVSTNK